MRLVISLLLFLTLPLASPAEVITHDPNASGARQEEETTQTTDPRLARKITCTPGYTRLHTAVEELSRVSGVTIRCGTNNDDWHVRDIPVVVWIKDLPLGKALESLALATHTQLSSFHLDDVITYRISSKLERQISNYERDKQKAIIEALKWDWDTAIKLKDLPASAYKPGKHPKRQAEFTGLWPDERIERARAIGSVLALLGTEVRDRVIDDGKYQVNWDDASPALRSVLTGLGRATIEEHKAIMIRQSKGSFDASTLPRLDGSGRVSLSLSCKREVMGTSGLQMSVDVNDGASGVVHIVPGEYTPLPPGFCIWTDLSRDTSSLARFATGIDLGERPTLPEQPVDNELPAGYIELAKTDDGSDPKPLGATVDLAAPTGKDLKTADALVQLAKTTGLSIVSEDFQSHLDIRAALMFGSGRSIADVLRKSNQLMWNADMVPMGGRDWFVDESSNLILGRSMEWVRQHQNLVPEKLITHLTDKLNGDGVILDDIIPVGALSKGQMFDWFTMSNDLQPLRDVVSGLTDESYGSWWRLQSKLSNDQKALAQSKEGLPLNLVDPTDALQALSGCRMGRTVAENVFGSVDAIDPQELRYFTWHARRDSRSAKQLIQTTAQIRVDGQPMPQARSAAAMSQIDSVDWHTWHIDLSYDKGETHTGSFSSVGPFPIFSPKRLAELQAQAQKAQ